MFRHGWKAVLAMLGALVPSFTLAPATVKQVAAEEALPPPAETRVCLRYRMDQAARSRLGRVLAGGQEAPAVNAAVAAGKVRPRGIGAVPARVGEGGFILLTAGVRQSSRSLAEIPAAPGLHGERRPERGKFAGLAPVLDSAGRLDRLAVDRAPLPRGEDIAEADSSAAAIRPVEGSVRILVLVHDGEVIAAPDSREPITGGEGRVSGSFSLDETADLALMLRFGSPPVRLALAERRPVEACKDIETTGPPSRG